MAFLEDQNGEIDKGSRPNEFDNNLSDINQTIKPFISSTKDHLVQWSSRIYSFSCDLISNSGLYDETVPEVRKKHI